MPQNSAQRPPSPIRGSRSRRLGLGIALLLGAAGHAAAVAAQEASAQPERVAADLGAAVDALEPEDRRWLQSVAGLITEAELRHFLDLTEPYRREEFRERFWEPRDPDPSTPRNELRQRWREILDRGAGLPYGDPRFVLYLLQGPPGGYSLPNGRSVARCFSARYELEIWFYGATPRARRGFPVIFQRRGAEAPYEVYYPGVPIRPLRRAGGLPTTDVNQLCADELLRYATGEIVRTTRYDRLMEEMLTPPLPSAEWLAGLAASGTGIPAGAETFETEVEITFPARRQSRTAVRVMLGVPRAEAAGRRFEGELYHNFRLRGEVVRDGSLLESFEYLFEGPTPEDAERIPIGFTRYLRPGEVRLQVLVEDRYTRKYARIERRLQVPSPDGLPPEASPLAAAEERQRPALELLAPPGDAQSGLTRFSARAEEEFDKVTFFLDERPVVSKLRPPYSVELDLGPQAAPRRVRVVGFRGGAEVATDQIWLNQGARRFEVRLVEPRPGGIYPGAATARVEVITPGAEAPETVELFVDDERVAVLEGPPLTVPLRLEPGRASVVRAVARLGNGETAEDAVVVNAPGVAEEVEVRLVQLDVLVLDAAGRPVRDLARERFRVLVEGKPQPIASFSGAAEAPLRLALLIDRSASMEPYLDAVGAAALAVSRRTLDRPGDELSLLSFDERLRVDAEAAATVGDLERAVAALAAEGQTALHDAVVQTLNRLRPEAGLRALLLFTDGEDDSSRLSFDEMRETARRAGVTLYAVGLAPSFERRSDRRRLEDLASETGGRAIFVEDIGALEAAFDSILADLRARYLVAVRPAEQAPGFYAVRVEVELDGAEARTRSGFWLGE